MRSRVDHHRSLTGTIVLSTRRVRLRSPLVAAVGIVFAVSTAVGCSSDEHTQRSTSRATSTSAPTVSTVDDADFESQATTAELMIRNAGTDPCAVIKAFSPASSLPTPISPTQTERGAKVVAGLFRAAAASAPPEAAGDAQVLANAADALIAEGEAAKWDPAWVVGVPKAISTPAVAQAFANFQGVVATTCNPSAATTTAGG